MAIKQPPAYVEAHDALRFPAFKRFASLIAPDERALHTEVVIVDGKVIQGHLPVALAIVESWTVENGEPLGRLLGWIAKSASADLRDEEARVDWFREHRSFRDPVGRDRLYDQAGLSPAQVIAMRMVYGDPPRAQRAVAVELGISQGALQDRLEKAKAKLREVL